MEVWVNVWGKALERRFGILAVTLGWCVVGCIDDFSHPEGYGESSSNRAPGSNGGTGGRKSVSHSQCVDLCVETSCGDLPRDDCSSQCAAIEDLVRDAGCQDSFYEFFVCSSALGDPCGGEQEACYSELNDFTNCISVYCGSRPERCGSL